MFGNNRGGYGSSSYDYSARNSNYGYGYGYSNQPRRRGLFGRGRDDYGYNSYGGYGGGYGGGGMFGRGLFGGRSYGAYTGRRRGIFSAIFGGVGLGIAAIGSLIAGAAALRRHQKERQTEKGKRAFGTMDLTMLLQQRGSTSVLKLPIILSLFYLGENEEQMESRFTVKVGKSSTVSANVQKVMSDLDAGVQDGTTHCVNFDITQQEGRGKLVLEPKVDCNSKDEWIKLQAICDSLATYFVSVEDLLDSMSIRHQPLEFSRLASTTLAAVLEQSGFMSAKTVDCKHDWDGEDYSWCVTDVTLRRKNREPVVVRVDLLHYAFSSDDEEAEDISDTGVSYAFAAGGTDIYDGRELVLGSGLFTGWDDVDSHIAEVSKGMIPITQAKKGKHGRYRKIPIVTSLVTKYRNGKRIGARRERRKEAFAADPNTDVIFRNLLWYDTKSKPGKMMIKVLPFCFLVTYKEVDGVPDRDSKPIGVGYNFLPVETEYLCGDDDIDLYAEEVIQGVSFPINFGLSQKEGRYVLRQKKINSLTDDWERLQELAERSAIIVDTAIDGFGDWVKATADESLSSFESAVLAAVLKLAGFSYARPVAVEKEWSVVDVALVRPKTHKTLSPKRFSSVSAGLQRRTETFSNFLDNKRGLLAQATSDSVVVRVDIHVNPITYGYSEEAVEDEGSAPIVSDLRTGCEPFLGWREDVDYQLRRKSGQRAARKQQRDNNAAQRETRRQQVPQGKQTVESKPSDYGHAADQAADTVAVPVDVSAVTESTAGGDLQQMDL